MQRWDPKLLDDDGCLDLEAWALRVRTGISVGRCSCGGNLEPLPAERIRGVVWLSAVCATCHREIAAPNRKTGARSLLGVA